MVAIALVWDPHQWRALRASGGTHANCDNTPLGVRPKQHFQLVAMPTAVKHTTEHFQVAARPTTAEHPANTLSNRGNAQRCCASHT